jgi:hypothetical protein
MKTQGEIAVAAHDLPITMESPHKRLKSSPITGDDFVSFANDNEVAEAKYGYGNEQESPANAPLGPRGRNERQRDARFDRRNALDRPKTKHVLPGHDSWILVKTKFDRRFVHNVKTKESFWHVPADIQPAVKAFESGERESEEKAANARWAEEELAKMRAKPVAVDPVAAGEERSRRRRSESLQREDEEAMMAELAAEADGQGGASGGKGVVKTLEPVAGDVGYDSDGSFEYVEVTDDEDEEGGDDRANGEYTANSHAEEPAPAVSERGDQPVEFGEDDIAYQLAAMGEEYGLDPGEYGDGEDAYMKDYDDGEAGLPISDEDAANLFRDLLDDYGISPFMPWDKVVADESERSILNDDRYTVLPTMRARKEVWDVWSKEAAARLREEREKMERLNPRIPYLALLAEKATPKLYWPEFKRKYKKEASMNDRKLSDKEREKLYRDHISRLTLPESTRKADLTNLLRGIPLRELNRSTTLNNLPQQLLSHLHFISLPASVRDRLVTSHIASLPPAPGADDLTDEQRAEEDKRRADKRRREDALAERQRKVDEEKRRVEKEERFAKRELRENERDLEAAMAVPRRG